EVRLGRPIGLLVAHQELGNGLVRATVVEHDPLREVQDGDADRAQLRDLALDPDAQGPARGARHEGRIEARDWPTDQLGEVEAQRDDALGAVHRAPPRRWIEPAAAGVPAGATRAGSSMKIWAPGNGGRFSSSGGASS